MKRLPHQLNIAAVLALAIVFVLAAPALANDVRGTILSIEPDDHTLELVAEDGNVLSFRALVTVEVFINDEDKSMWDLKAGDEVTIVYDVEKEVMLATIIRCNRLE